MPASDMHAGTSAVQCLGDPRQCLPAVNQQLERVSPAWGRIPRAPQRRTKWGVQLLGAPDTLQAAAVMRSDRRFDRLTSPAVDALSPSSRHLQSLYRLLQTLLADAGSSYEPPPRFRFAPDGALPLGSPPVRLPPNMSAATPLQTLDVVPTELLARPLRRAPMRRLGQNIITTTRKGSVPLKPRRPTTLGGVPEPAGETLSRQGNRELPGAPSARDKSAERGADRR